MPASQKQLKVEHILQPKIEMTQEHKVDKILLMVGSKDIKMLNENEKYAEFAARLNSLMSSPESAIRDINALKDTAGVTYEMARRYTLGTAKPRDEKMLKIAKALNVSPSYLDYGETEQGEEYPTIFQATANRIKQALLDKGLSIKELKEWNDSNQVGGLTALAKHLNVSPTWLVDGSGDKHSLEITPIEDWDNNTPLENDEVEIPFFKDFQLSCGNGSISEALHNEHRRLRLSRRTLDNVGVQKDNAIAVTAQGDSMFPTIRDKATVYIDTSRTRIKDGKMFAIQHGGLFKIKYLYALPLGGVRLVSENSEEYPEEKLTAQEMEEQLFQILGQVFSVSTMINL